MKYCSRCGSNKVVFEYSVLAITHSRHLYLCQKCLKWALLWIFSQLEYKPLNIFFRLLDEIKAQADYIRKKNENTNTSKGKQD